MVTGSIRKAAIEDGWHGSGVAPVCERNPTVMSDPNDGMSGYEVDMVVNQVTGSLQWGVSVVKSDTHEESRVPRTLDVPHNVWRIYVLIEDLCKCVPHLFRSRSFDVIKSVEGEYCLNLKFELITEF